MLNFIAIHGRLTADPDLKTTQSGVSVCNFTVAVDRNYAKQGEEKLTDFFNVVAWRGLADIIARNFHKGKEIVVNGEMQCEKWVDDNGQNRSTWKLNASSVDFCGRKEDSNGTLPNSAPAPVPKQTPSVPQETQTTGNLIDDDLPF